MGMILYRRNLPGFKNLAGLDIQVWGILVLLCQISCKVDKRQRIHQTY